MLIKEQIPSFPELVHLGVLLDYVAHGTSDHKAIEAKYHSSAESEYAEELAFERIFNLLREGKIRGTGRASAEKKGTAKRWQGQQYRNHSKKRTYVEPEFWADFIFQHISYYRTARNPEKEYTDIKLVLDDCREHLAAEIQAHNEGQLDDEAAKSVATSEYTTPYIELMWKAIDEFQITKDRQPVKKTLVEWFVSQDVEGQRVSAAAAEYLATFVRLPSSQSGGNRPWKVRAQSQQPADQ